MNILFAIFSWGFSISGKFCFFLHHLVLKVHVASQSVPTKPLFWSPPPRPAGPSPQPGGADPLRSVQLMVSSEDVDTADGDEEAEARLLPAWPNSAPPLKGFRLCPETNEPLTFLAVLVWQQGLTEEDGLKGDDGMKGKMLQTRRQKDQFLASSFCLAN